MGSPLEDMKMSDEERRATQMTDDEREKSEHIKAYNAESIRTGRKNPFGEPDLIPDQNIKPTLEQYRATKERLKESQRKSGFGIGPEDAKADLKQEKSNEIIGIESGDSEIDLDSLDLRDFEQSEQFRKERLKRGLSPMGELDVNINHAEYLAGTGYANGKRLLEAALLKKKNYLEGKQQAEYHPPTQTQTQRKEDR